MKTLNFKVSILVWLIFISSSFAQIIEESGTIEQFVDAIIDEMPREDSDEFQLPTSQEENAWELFFSDVVAGNFETAATNAPSVGYEIVKFTDTDNSNDYYVARKSAASSNWWGTYIFYPEAKRSDLVFEAPHAIKDKNTGKESALAFKNLGAWSLSITGTHRCNNTVLSVCDGTTGVCSGGTTKYRISDMAHSVDAIFYNSTILIDNQKQNLAKHIQLHGFGRNNDDPAFIISNGVTDQPSGEDMLQNLANNLLSVDDSYTSEIAHKNPDIKLKGTSNTIGRWLNASTDPCDESADINSGRFFHLEQALEGVRDTEANWLKVIDALAMTFPVDVVSSIEENQLQFDAYISPNPSENGVTISYRFKMPAKVQRSILDLSGNVIWSRNFETISNLNHSEVIDKVLPSGIYIFRIESEEEIKNIKFIQK